MLSFILSKTKFHLNEQLFCESKQASNFRYSYTQTVSLLITSLVRSSVHSLLFFCNNVSKLKRKAASMVGNMIIKTEAI